MLFVGCVLPTLLATSTLLDQVFAARSATNSVLLSKVKTLTLRKDAKTSHRRVSAIPQLKCIGGNARGLYEVDVMRCQNQGSDYDDDKWASQHFYLTPFHALTDIRSASNGPVPPLSLHSLSSAQQTSSAKATLLRPTLTFSKAAVGSNTDSP